MTAHELEPYMTFCLWCVIGWLLIFVRNSETKMSFILWESSGYKKTSEIMGVITIILWPLASPLAVAVSWVILQQIKKKNASKGEHK